MGIEIRQTAPKNRSEEQDVPKPTIYSLNLNLIFLTMELVDMPTKFQHSLEKSNSYINIIINQLGTPKFTSHYWTRRDST